MKWILNNVVFNSSFLNSTKDWQCSNAFRQTNLDRFDKYNCLAEQSVGSPKITYKLLHNPFAAVVGIYRTLRVGFNDGNLVLNRNAKGSADAVHTKGSDLIVRRYRSALSSHQ